MTAVLGLPPQDMKLAAPRVGFYVGAVCVSALYCLAQASWTVPDADQASAIAAFLLLGLLSEAGSFRLQLSTATSSIAFIPFLAAILLFPAGWAMVIAGLTWLIADLLIRRKPVIKAAHNTAKEVVAVGVASFCFQLFGGEPSLATFAISVTTLPGLVFGVASYFAISHGGTTLAIAIAGRTPVSEVWNRLIGAHLMYDLSASSLAALLAYLYVMLDFGGLLVVVLPLLFVRHLYHMAIRLEQSNQDLLGLMVKSIEARDPYTSGHSVRVSRLAEAIARDVGLRSQQVKNIATAALLHDVGKIYEEFARILRKEGKLEPWEVEMIRTHPVRSAELVSTISSLQGDVEKAVRHHHESYDGSGYPDGLSANAIPLGARIISIADTVDAMTTTRPYRDALPYWRVVGELTTRAGVQFDPALVDLFCSSTRIADVVRDFIAQREVPEPASAPVTFVPVHPSAGSQRPMFGRPGELPTTRARRLWRRRKACSF